MFCHNCGNPDQKSDAYCTRCGLWLHKTGKSLNRTTSPEEKLRAMRSFSGINALMAALAATLLYVAHLGKGGHWSVYVAASFCSVIAVHQAISFFFNLQIQRRLKQNREGKNLAAPLYEPPVPQALPEARPLPFVQPRSVTENTTELLEAVPRRPVRRD